MHPSMMPRRKTTIVTSCSIYQRSRRLITRYADQHDLPSQNPELGGIPMQMVQAPPLPRHHSRQSPGTGQGARVIVDHWSR